MQNSKIVIVFLLVLMVSASAFSQSTTNSPYSRYGVGILRPGAFATGLGMGGVGIGLRANRNINILNPASYSSISVTTFDVGYTNNALWLEDGTETQYENNSYINHISFAFPMIKNKWGMSFGVLPFSNIGYKYDEVITDPVVGEISFFSEGSGAINKAYLGNAIAVKIDSNSLISFGANTYFLFGAFKHDEKLIYGDLPGAFNLWRTKDISISDFGADFGLQYEKNFTNTKDEKYKLVIGATYGLASDLDAKRSEITRTFTGSVDFGTLKDTVELIDEVDEIIQLPSQLGFGISLEKYRRWLLAIDYKSSNWGKIASNDALFEYKSNYSLNGGIQFIPKYDGNSYFQRMAYRVGGRFSNSHLVINDVDWSEYGITFGLGLPVRKSGSTFPRLNLGFEYGSRGTTDSGLIKEKFFNFNVGLTINAVWFRKRKIE